MKYLHVSKTFKTLLLPNGTPYIVWSVGKTYNIGRNKKKRALREGKPRKEWRVLRSA